MQEFAGFFDGVHIGEDEDGNDIYDREYNSDELSLMVKSFFKTGIYPNPSSNLQVTASDDMKVSVLPGAALLNGRFYQLKDGIKVLTLVDSDNTKARIDLIVTRLDLDKRTITTEVVRGMSSTQPQTPKLTRNERVFEICLAEVTIKPGVTNISQANIKDTRHIDSLCGVITGAITQIDTSELYKQYEAALMEKVEELNNLLESENAVGEILAGLDKKQDKVIKDKLSTGEYELEVRNGKPYLRVVKV